MKEAGRDVEAEGAATILQNILVNCRVVTWSEVWEMVAARSSPTSFIARHVSVAVMSFVEPIASLALSHVRVIRRKTCEAYVSRCSKGACILGPSDGYLNSGWESTVRRVALRPSCCDCMVLS